MAAGISRRSLLAFALAPAAACASAPRVIAEEHGLQAFVDVRVLAAYGRTPLERHTVVVRGDRIIAIGPSERIVLPAGVARLGRAGQVVAPGLADMHVHIFEPNDGIFSLACGVTTVRNMSGRQGTRDLAARIAAGDAPGPTIYSSGPIIDGALTPAEVRRLIEAQAGAGYMAVKLYENLAPDAFAAGVAAARVHHMQVYAHVPLAMSLEQVLDLRIDSIEHLTGFDRALAPLPQSDWDEQRWAAADLGRMAGLARRVAQSGVWNAPTLVTLLEPPRAFLDIDAATASPRFRSMTPRVRGLWREQAEATRAQRDPQLSWEMTQRAHGVRLAMVRALREADAPLLIGTDAPQPFVYPGFALHEEFALNQDAGLSPTDILRIATRDAAGFLKREREFGAIAEGARADLLLLDGDPEAQLGVLQAPAGVMAAGRWYDAAALAGMLEDVAERTAAAPAPQR